MEFGSNIDFAEISITVKPFLEQDIVRCYQLNISLFWYKKYFDLHGGSECLGCLQSEISANVYSAGYTGCSVITVYNYAGYTGCSGINVYNFACFTTGCSGTSADNSFLLFSQQK